MKINKAIFYILMLLPLLAVIIALQFLPEQIPAHYNIENQVDRWGSKYESLIFPGFIILFGLFMLGMSKLAAKREKDGSNNERVCIIIGTVTLIMFDAMTGFFLYTAFNQIENLSSAPARLNGRIRQSDSPFRIWQIPDKIPAILPSPSPPDSAM